LVCYHFRQYKGFEKETNMRILSLLPSATEIVYALGLGDNLVGVSHECDYPPEVKTKPVVSTSDLSSTLRSAEIHGAVSAHRHPTHSLYRIDEQLLRQIDPEVILTQELCNVCAIPVAQVREAARILAGPCRIVSLEPNNLRQILDCILTVGEVAGQEERARAVTLSLQERIDRVAAAAARVNSRPRVLCMEWMDPPMAGGHWVPEMIRLAGGIDGLGHEGAASTVIAWERVVEYGPEAMVIMPCGYKIARTLSEMDRFSTRGGWYDLPAVRAGRVYVVDSPSYFSRPGPRTVYGLEMLAEIIHPELFSGLIPPGAAVKLDWNQEKPMQAQSVSERFSPLG
jgi:iron complex transport system substrate-binding protein